MYRRGKFASILVSVALGVSVVALPAPTLAATGTVTVRVTIDKVSALDCFEGSTPFGCAGSADFYSVVTIDGVELPASSPIDDQNNADPNPDWVFERAVDATKGSVPVSIAIYDEDGAFRLGDDHADIDPTNGGDTSNLDLTVRVAPVCQVSGDATLAPDQCGKLVSSSGTADNNKARVFYEIEVIDPDTDGDWLPDSWETFGLDADGNGTIDLDLPAMGANPGRKDLFLEIDCLVATGNHSHCPVQGAVQAVVQAFADAPVPNSDGSTGIQLHIDIGSLYGHADGADTIVTRTGGGTTGSFGNYGGGGDQIDETGNLVVDWDGAAGNPATNFYTLKAGYFDTTTREFAFRYGLFAHQVNARSAANDCTSGWAEGGIDDAGSPFPGNDLIVSLGGVRGDGTLCWGADAGGNSVGTQNEQAGTLLHEFGHTLSLDHGGADGINNKPNYLGVMNYSFQDCRVPAVPGRIPGGCDLSRVALPTLYEALPPGLDECAGIGLGLGGVDWNGDGTLTGASCSPSSGNVSANANGDFNDTNNNGKQDADEASILQTLPGYDDWSNLRFDFRTQGNFSDGSVPPFRNEANPETIAAARAFMSELLRPVLSVDKKGPADAIPGDTLDYSISLSNAGSGPALNVELSDTLPDGTTAFRSTFGTFVVGATTTKTASHAVSCAVADGTVLANEATARGTDLLGNVVTGSDVVNTTIHAPVLELTSSATSSVGAGEAITYRLEYRNSGSGTAESVSITDTLPVGVYYSPALDLGAGPQPGSVVRNADGTTTLTWDVGTLVASSTGTIEFTARPTLLSVSGTEYVDASSVSYTNANGCVFTPVEASSQTTISGLEPLRDPKTIGFWRNHEDEWTAEMLARIQATDQQYDGADGTSPDGALSTSEMGAMLTGVGGFPDALLRQLLSGYANLATREIVAETLIDSKTTRALGLANVRDAALYAQVVLQLPVNSTTKGRYDDANRVIDEINNGRSEEYD